MNYVTTCLNKRLGSIPIKIFFSNCLELISFLCSITVLGFKGRFIMKFHRYHFILVVCCSSPAHTRYRSVHAGSVLCVTASVVWVR